MKDRCWGTPVTLQKLLDDSPLQEEIFSLDASMIKRFITEDLSQLLNTQPTEIASQLNGGSLIDNSVLNYGLGIVIGDAITSQHYHKVEEAIKRAITRFEPRIDPHTLIVTVLPITTRTQSISQLSLNITAEIRFYPQNLALTLAGTYDTVTTRTWFE
ncbi:type VI secretion system baseplate subunit TssE [Rosenbergiella metrosideri]|uniref:type VI secretion system baseplate subunit TssE n=1 Tax=Rosenbergiella metrosideri TaxID=2921185 RepID=UPI001F500F91|nr:GPW/gp25 family protein [Rosenbergiella metrosideri]